MPDEPLPSSVFTIVSDEQEPPRLRIIHFMVWMLCAAPLMTIFRKFRADSNLDSHLGTVLDSAYLLHGTFSAAVLTGSVTLIYAWIRRGVPLYRQPGHCLLYVQSVMLIGSIVVGFVNEEIRELEGLSMMLYGGLQLISALGYLLAAIAQKQYRWLFLFLALFFTSLLQCGQYVLLAVSIRSGSYWESYEITVVIANLITAAMGLWLIVAMVIDTVQQQKRDWLHWTGTVCYLAQLALHLLWNLAFSMLN